MLSILLFLLSKIKRVEISNGESIRNGTSRT